MKLKRSLKLIAPTLTSHENDLISRKGDVNWYMAKTKRYTPFVRELKFSKLLPV